jgi:phospholipid/cholesterol/gamma-HCH transport system permease protein
MPTATDVSSAHAQVREHGDELIVALRGRWRITEPHPDWDSLVQKRRPRRVRLEADGLAAWDSSLLLVWRQARRWCEQHGAELDDASMPPRAQVLMAQFAEARVRESVGDRAPKLFTAVGLATAELWQKTKDIAHFVGECTLSAISVA